MKKTLALVNAVGLLIGISYGLHNPIVPIFAKNEIGASYADLGFIGLANFVPYMFIPLFVGVMLHRFNNAKILSFGIIINSASTFLLSQVNSVAEIMVLRALTGVAHAFFWPPAESIISNSGTESRVKNIGRFTGFFVSGFMIGPLAGTFLLDGLDMTYRMIFEVSTFVTAAAIIFSIQLVKRGLPQQSPEFTFSVVRQMARFPQVITILIFYASSFGMILTIYPAFLNDRSMSATEIEMLFFVFGVSRVATLASTEKLARRTSLTLIASTLCISAGLLISFYSDSIFGFGAAMLLMGFGFSIVFPLTLEIILRQTKKETAGIVIGAYETTFGIGWAVGPVTAGLISEFSGNSMPYLVFFGIGIAVFVFSVIKRKALEPVPN